MATTPETPAQETPATETPATETPAQEAPAQETPAGDAPPWGDDFDPARAWATIQRLRAEVRDAKAAAKAPEPAEAPKAPEPDPSLTERLERAEAAARDAQRALWRERALRVHDVPDDLADLVTGDTEEAVNAMAERLAGRVKPAPADDADGMPERPQPALTPTPGHGGESPISYDYDAIAAAC